MTAQRVACPGRILPRDRHDATSTRWTVTTPAGLEIGTCSAACAVDWLVKALPADLEHSASVLAPSDDAGVAA